MLSSHIPLLIIELLTKNLKFMLVNSSVVNVRKRAIFMPWSSSFNRDLLY